MVGKKGGVVPNAPDESRGAAGQPGQAQQIQARHGRNPAFVHRPPPIVEAAGLEPAIIQPVTRGPDDCRDAGLLQVELQGRCRGAGQAGREAAGTGLLGQVEPFAACIGVGFVQHGKVIGITECDAVGKIGRKAHHPAVEVLSPAGQHHSARGQVTEIDGVPPARAADGDGDVFLPGLANGGAPLAEDAKPPHEIPPAIAAGRPVVRTNGKMDAAPGAQQLIGDLHPGRPGADHQHRALRELGGVAVGAGMDLDDPGFCRNQGRDDRALEWAGGGDEVVGLEHASRSFDTKAALLLVACARDGDAAADRSRNFFRVGTEVVHDAVPRRECVGVHVGERKAREPVVPGRPVGDQRVPALRAPAFSNPPPLEHEVRQAVAAEVLTHRNPGLAGADDERSCSLDRHGLPRS